MSSNRIRVVSALAGSYPEHGMLGAQWEGWDHTAELVSALAGSYPEHRVLGAQSEGWDHTAELHPLQKYVFE